MKNSTMTTIASLLLVLLMTFHLADDIIRGYENGGLSNLLLVPIVLPWLCAAVLLAGRRSGYIVSLIYSLLSIGVPIIHMKGRGVGLSPRVAHTTGGFFFVWTLLAIAVLGAFAAILSARGIIRPRTDSAR